MIDTWHTRQIVFEYFVLHFLLLKTIKSDTKNAQKIFNTLINKKYISTGNN